MTKPESEFLDFTESKLKLNEENRKTKIFVVTSKRNPNMCLGFIKWYGPWRKYVFNTECAIFDVKCLNDIVAFITYLMEERKMVRRFSEKTGFDLVDEDAVS